MPDSLRGAVSYVDMASSPPIVSFGVVESVSIGLHVGNAFVYHISTREGPVIYSIESSLQWGPSCPVWARPVGLSAELSAIVIGSYNTASQVLYSVQDASDSSSMFHGVPPERIRYRPTSAVTSASEAVVVANHSSHDRVPSQKVPALSNTPLATGKRSEATRGVSSASNEMMPASKRLKVPLETSRGPSVAVVSHDGPHKDSPIGSASSITEDDLSSIQCSVGASAASRRRGRKKQSNRVLIIPTNILDVDEIKDALIGENGVEHKKLVHRTRCKISLRTDLEDHQICAVIKGSEQNVESASREIEQILVDCVGEQDAGRMLYSDSNSASKSNGLAVFQRSPDDLDTMAWGASFHFKGDLPRATIGRVIGKKRSGLNKVQEKSDGCSISANTNPEKTTRPHLFVLGDSTEAVNGCIELIKERMKWAKSQGPT